MTPEGPYELLDNYKLGYHREALGWLKTSYPGLLSVATGFVNLGGLDALARLDEGKPGPIRLLLGASPPPGLLSNQVESEHWVRDRFAESIHALSRERDFQSFPPLRRQALERVSGLLAKEEVQVRRYTRRFLHGKSYLFGQTDGNGHMRSQGAALISSANLTAAGLSSNLELGLVQYQPNVVRLALEWFDSLWDKAAEYKDELLELLVPDVLESDPQTIFLRTLLELYGDELPDETSTRQVARPGEGLSRFQLDGYRRARRILERYHGVVYADGVGSGKTEIGIAFIQEYAREKGLHTLIVCPAQLRDKLWKPRLDKANLPGQVVSYQELARDYQLVPNGSNSQHVLNVDKDAYRLVLVDEAHAFRTSGTTWYEALDRLMGGARKELVLLTATPVNNTLWDLYSLILLFSRHDSAFSGPPLRLASLRRLFLEAGANDPEQISETHLFPMIDAVTVRRDRAFLEKHYAHDRFPDGTPVKFPKPVLLEKRYDLDSAYPSIVQEIVDAIDALTMARYRPSAYDLREPQEAAHEEALAGLLKSGLLKRFESSWYAALKTAQRMRVASDVFLEALESHGVVPSPAMIREMTLEIQGGGALGELVTEALERAVSRGSAANFRDEFKEHLRSDLRFLEVIADKLHALGELEDPKIECLSEILQKTEAQKVAVFTSFADTAIYLREKLEVDPSLTSNRSCTVVIGSETDPEIRERELLRFCPRSVSGDAYESPADEVDLLISTDILSEGQNLQEAQAVVSFDMPWNPQRVVQRNGRVIRLKSPHDKVFLYTLLPEEGELEEILRLEARIRTKVAAANAALGMENPVLSEVPTESKVYADLRGFTERLAAGDPSLTEEDGLESGSFVGEEFRARLLRALAEGEIARLKSLPWGIGAAFARSSVSTGVFFACRTRSGERYWRFISRDGDIVREDLRMLQLIEPGSASSVPMPENLDLQALFDIAAEDICKAHNQQADPATQQEKVPASQRWALDILRRPEIPAYPEYDEADLALGVGRGTLVRRALSRLRREHQEGELTVTECAQRILEVVDSFGLEPTKPTLPPPPISKEDLGVVCYQVVCR